MLIVDHSLKKCDHENMINDIALKIGEIATNSLSNPLLVSSRSLLRHISTRRQPIIISLANGEWNVKFPDFTTYLWDGHGKVNNYKIHDCAAILVRC